MNRKRLIYSLAFTAIFLGAVFAANCPTCRLKNSLELLCGDLKGLVPVAAMLMVLLAAVIYATGQMMGAETRARANVWATSCLTGAIIGLLIATIAPPILSMIFNGTTGSITC